MRNSAQSDLFARFAPTIAACETSSLLTDKMLSELTLERAGPVSVVYAPFDYIPPSADLVIVGITPGRVQAENALRAARQALRAGKSQDEAGRLAKLTGSFSGPLRTNLVSMLDHIGLHGVLGVNTCARLFEDNRQRVHFTSALRYPVFVDGENYNGTPDMIRTPILRQMIETYLADEARALPNALWLPLGPKPAAALQHLASAGILDRSRILNGLPHPSGANAERIGYFLGRKAREALSAKTRPEPIDQARVALRMQISALNTVEAGR
jgi:hypothetical protein